MKCTAWPISFSTPFPLMRGRELKYLKAAITSPNCGVWVWPALGRHQFESPRTRHGCWHPLPHERQSPKTWAVALRHLSRAEPFLDLNLQHSNCLRTQWWMARLHLVRAAPGQTPEVGPGSGQTQWVPGVGVPFGPNTSPNSTPLVLPENMEISGLHSQNDSSACRSPPGRHGLNRYGRECKEWL